MISTFLAKKAMKIVEREPSITGHDVALLQEVFSHRTFLDADAEERKQIMLRSSESKYEDEMTYPWDAYFGFELKPLLDGKAALDLGCFTGGRTVAWHDMYNLASITGIDIKDEYIEAASMYSKTRGAKASFVKSVGESLPFSDDTFDAVLSFDVFEHVLDIEDTLSECKRVLKKGGQLFVVFPSYYQPLEHHLGLVSMTPGLHWVFSGKTLVKAYCEILDERGEDAYWYKRKSPTLEPWEKGHTINGATFAQFREIIARQGWHVYRQVHKPIGSVGRNVERNKGARLLGSLFFPLTYIPGLQELFLHRNTFILTK
jgi:SAM-dependent methyltransferase